MGEKHQVWDAVVVGAGITGIDAAYRLQTGCPGLQYTVLERRHEIGGTWSLFRYPGIRSDSDLYTFGFPFKVWNKENPIADAGSILSYMRSTAQEFGIDKHIQYHTEVITANWLTKRHVYEIDAKVNGIPTKIYAKFILWGSGYYDYSQGRQADIPGLSNFKGQVVHPQFWPENFDYTDKKCVIIGSGATAVTIIPNMAEKAARVTMLQRSPGYIVSIDGKPPIPALFRRIFSEKLASTCIRWFFLLSTLFFYNICQLFPAYMKRKLIAGTSAALPPHMQALTANYTPNYNPWDQRLCVLPQGDLFRAFHSGKADVATGIIKTVHADSIELTSGETIPADIIITATGLKLQLLGGAQIKIDGTPISLRDKYMWRGAMLTDVPNTMMVVGYSNVSYTLSADLTAKLAVKVINEMRKRGESMVVPRLGEGEEGTLTWASPVNLKSGYVENVGEIFPKTAVQAPWRPRVSYLRDWAEERWGGLGDRLEFGRL